MSSRALEIDKTHIRCPLANAANSSSLPHRAEAINFAAFYFVGWKKSSTAPPHSTQQQLGRGVSEGFCPKIKTFNVCSMDFRKRVSLWCPESEFISSWNIKLLFEWSWWYNDRSFVIIYMLSSLSSSFSSWMPDLWTRLPNNSAPPPSDLCVCDDSYRVVPRSALSRWQWTVHQNSKLTLSSAEN